MCVCAPTSGEVGVGERTGEAEGEVWLARGATPFDLTSLTGGFLPFMTPFALGGDTFPRLGSDLAPPPFTMATGGGVFGLGGLFFGVDGTLCFEEEEAGEV